MSDSDDEKKTESKTQVPPSHFVVRANLGAVESQAEKGNERLWGHAGGE